MEVRQEAEPYRHIVRSDLAYSALPKHRVHVYSDTKSGVRLVPQPKSRMGRDSAVAGIRVAIADNSLSCQAQHDVSELLHIV